MVIWLMDSDVSSTEYSVEIILKLTSVMEKVSIVFLSLCSSHFLSVSRLYDIKIDTVAV